MRHVVTFQDDTFYRDGLRPCDGSLGVGPRQRTKPNLHCAGGSLGRRGPPWRGPIANENALAARQGADTRSVGIQRRKAEPGENTGVVGVSR